MSERETPSIARVKATSTGLKRGMKMKAAVMTGVGGTIGTGVFLSSGDVLATAGPGGAIVSYVIGGIIAWLMTTCLGEMSAAMPVSGSLQAYSTEYVGPAMGFTIGWVSWVGSAATISAQIVACAILMKDIIPNSPTWVWIVAFTLLLFGVNLFDAKVFGNVSFWVSSLKILLIAGFIIVGGAMLFGGFGSSASIGHESGGAFPTGIAGIAACILTSFYAFAGTEIVATTAGELEDERKMGKTINWTIFILVAAVVLSMTVCALLLPWEQADVLGSPFVYVFRNAGFNGAALLVNIIVLTSALTSGNYFVFGCARYLWSMSKFHQAPKIFSKTLKNGVPYIGLIVSMLFGLFGILSEFFAEDTVYLFIVYFIGGGNIFTYTVTCICQYRFRKRYIAEGGRIEDLKFKVASFPLIPILGVIAFMLMLVATLTDPGERFGIMICAICYVIIYICARIYVSKKGNNIKSVDI